MKVCIARVLVCILLLTSSLFGLTGIGEGFHKCTVSGDCPGGDPGPGHGVPGGDPCEPTLLDETPGDLPVYEMVAFGDSVIWGQGLRDQEKFSSLVQKAIARSTRRVVRLRSYAHSGASIQRQNSNDERKKHPEVPHFYPTIQQQSQCVQESDRSRVQLALVDGCANDMRVSETLPMTLKDPSLWNGWGEWVDRWAKKYCQDDMTSFLRGLVSVYPNARIVVTGYFPIISEQSDETGIIEYLKYFIPIHPLFSLPSVLRTEIAARSNTWTEVSKKYVGEAVRVVNEEVPGRITFVHPDFDANNAAWAPKSLLWHPENKDPLETVRSQLPSCGKDYWCRNASSFHPNPSGAREYAKKISGALGYSFEPAPMSRMGAAITVLSRAPRMLDAWITGNDGQIHTANYNDDRGVWLGWFNLGAPAGHVQAGARVQVLSRAPKMLDAWVVGRDGHVYTANYNDDRGSWNGWADLGSPVSGVEPAATVTVLSRAPKMLDAWVVGRDGRVYTANYNDDRGSWSGWADLGSPVSGMEPAATVTVLSRAPKMLDAWVVGRDGHVYTANYNDDRGSWNGWTDLGTTPNGIHSQAPITVITRGVGLLDAWVASKDGMVYTANYNDSRGTWNGWSSIGQPSYLIHGVLPASPITVLARSPGFLDAWVAGLDGEIYTANYNDVRGTWSRWFPMPYK